MVRLDGIQGRFYTDYADTQDMVRRDKDVSKASQVSNLKEEEKQRRAWMIRDQMVKYPD
jgi:hypothetical protein